jgi:excisionase family DNA binding protein
MAETKIGNPMLRLREAAAYLAVSEDHLALMARRREIGVVRAAARRGSPMRFRISDLDAWAAKHVISPIRK